MKGTSKNFAVMALAIIVILGLTAICAGAVEIDAPYSLAEGNLPVDDGQVEHNFFVRLWNMILDTLRQIKNAVLDLINKLEKL